jgi:hypothetical protein
MTLSQSHHVINEQERIESLERKLEAQAAEMLRMRELIESTRSDLVRLQNAKRATIMR